MERTLSADEKIRRAEEIYYRKKIQATSRNSARVNVTEKKDFSLLKKMILQIIICILIYTIFYMIQNTNYIFSDDVIDKTKQILSYDINLHNLYNQAKDYIKMYLKPKNEENNALEEQIEEKQPQESIEDEENQANTENTIEENESIGGENVANIEDKTVSLTQMEQDAKYIIENRSLILPLKGTITSRYGERSPTTPTVPKYHTGIDIAVNEGTVFIASMEGTVQTVSSVGDYRKSCKNNKWRCYDIICTLQNNICKRR